MQGPIRKKYSSPIEKANERFSDWAFNDHSLQSAKPTAKTSESGVSSLEQLIKQRTEIEKLFGDQKFLAHFCFNFI
jgi:hypothetical protein